MHFSFNWRTGMNNVKQPNKHYIHFLISKEHLYVLLYVTSSLVQKSVLIKWHWGCYPLTCQIIICQQLYEDQPVPQSLQDFHYKQGTKGSLLLSESYQRKTLTSQTSTRAHMRHYYAMLQYVFLMFSYILKMFLLTMFWKLTFVLLDSSLQFETAISLKSS